MNTEEIARLAAGSASTFAHLMGFKADESAPATPAPAVPAQPVAEPTPAQPAPAVAPAPAADPAPAQPAPAPDAAKAERARCAAIFKTAAAATRPDMAAHLAFETDLSAETAVGMLEMAVKGQPAKADKASAFADRMARAGNPDVTPDGGTPGAKAIASSWDASAARVGSKLRR